MTSRLASPVLLLCALSVLAIGIGSSWIGPDRVLAALVGQGSQTDQIIIWTLRLPRVALAILAGAALALAGMLLQRIVRNAIASPSVLGIVDGAAVGVVLFLWIWSNEANALTVSIHWLPAAATLGAAVFALLVVAVAGRDAVVPARLILYGIALAALAKALVVVLIILGPVYRASTALIWLAGSVHAAHWDDVAILAAVLAASVLAIALLLRPLDQILLDDRSASATGLALIPAKAGCLALAVILTAGAVSFAGGIGFVGLIAPNIARALVGLSARAQLLTTPFIGAAMVLGADIIARTVAYPLELPTGAITALIGAPYFLFLLLRQVRYG
ncbi:MAG: iron ABC transporter permease [Pseudomonadota bacterium]